MTRVYRILRKPYSRTPLDGEGAYRFGGRWSSVATRLAYTAEHLSLAMIEYFVHIDSNDPPKDLVLVAAEVPDNVSRTSISPKQLPPNWRQSPSPPELAGIGDRFVRYARAAILVVPSALVPAESNWLINPQHSESSRIRLHSVEPFQYEPRFFK
ncbi:MAG: RES family NAD+ phosphorylase [Candidatus Solibacter usitatus]|nr:RES family NAD+ phosphorylase [Candidatus Solibacter usitatus]